MASDQRVGITDPERGLRASHAAKLIVAAETIRSVLDELDVGSVKCHCCGLNKHSNYDEFRAADELKSTIRKLYKLGGRRGEADTL